MMRQARGAYGDAREIAEKGGRKARAQMAEVLSAFTFARDGNPKRAIKLLEKLAAKPVDRESEALTWLSIGNARRLSSDNPAALQAYRRALTLTDAGTAMHTEVADAIASLHQVP